MARRWGWLRSRGLLWFWRGRLLIRHVEPFQVQSAQRSTDPSLWRARLGWSLAHWAGRVPPNGPHCPQRSVRRVRTVGVAEGIPIRPPSFLAPDVATDLDRHWLQIGWTNPQRSHRNAQMTVRKVTRLTYLRLKSR